MNNNPRKKLILISAILLAVVVLLSLAKNIIVDVSLSNWARSMTGADLRVDSMDIGIIKTRVDIKGLKLFNPPGFPGKLLADMPEVYVDYDLAAFFRRKIHFEEIRLNLKELNVIRNEEGKVNVDSLNLVQGIKGRHESTKKDEMPELKIDLLKLKIGKVVFKNYSRGLTPIIVEYEVNIDEQFENINDPYQFASILVAKSLTKTPLEQLAEFDLRSLTREANKAWNDALDETKKATSETVEKAKDTLKKIFPYK